jgi:6-pyruvoyl-tetrahydropterin synthase related domain
MSRILTAVRARLRAVPLEGWITAAVVFTAVVFTLVQLHPHLILRTTTPTGGDTGAHVWAGAYLRDHILPHGRLSGWTPDWYAGAPAFHFYMVVPFLFMLLLDTVMPYVVAFKIVTVLGVVLLPVAAWGFGRLSDLRFPGPALLAVATVPFLFDTRFTIYGGNIASTMAGEFAFAISLSLALVYLGVVARGLQTGRHRAAGAALLALVGLCHLIPAFFAIAGTAVMVLLYPRRASLRWVATVAPVAAALTAFWALPFAWRRDYMNDMGWEKIQPWAAHGLWSTAWWGRVGDSLWPWDLRWAWALAIVAVIVGVVDRKRPHLVLGAMTVLSGVAFVLLPQGRLWNARLLPFYYLGIYLLAALAVVEIARAVARRLGEEREHARRLTLVAAPALAILFAVVFVGLGLRALPFGHTDAQNRYHWLGLVGRQDNFVDGWARWNYSGYEARPPNHDGGGYNEYYDLVTTMDAIGQERGCGRAMWEYEPELVRYGTPMALMLLPHWTNGCIGSMEGLYFESSATTPYHFLNQSELSDVPSRAQRDLPYGPLDVDRGVEHLQLMGVRYYLTTSATALSQAELNPDLTQVGQSGPWTIFEVAGSELVSPLENLPAVLTDVGDSQQEWLDPAVDWYLDAEAHDVLLASDGPSDWPRVEEGQIPTAVPVDPVEVSAIETDDDRISFDVDQIGVPVLVKTSYFPNWQASGAEGPWRVTPNLMVVVPTSTHVELHYGWTPVDLVAWMVTIFGLVGFVVLLWRPPVPVPPDAEPVDQTVDVERDPDHPMVDDEPVPVGAGVGPAG